MSDLTDEAVASATLARWYRAWSDHDVDAVVELVTEDVVYEDPSAQTKVLFGRRALAGYARSALTAVPDLQLELLEEWIGPGGAASVSHFRMTGTFSAPFKTPGLTAYAPTDRPIDICGMNRSQITGSRIRRHQTFWNMADLGHQIAALPSRGSTLDKLVRQIQHLTARRVRRG